MNLLFALIFSTAASAKPMKFKHKPYWRPILGGHIFTANDDSYYGVNLGAEAGLMHIQKKKGYPKLVGRSRAQFVTVFGSGISSNDFRVGSFWGPAYRMISADFGPDLIYNTYSIADTNVDMGSATALAFPARVYIDLKVVSLTLGAGPTFYTSGDREGADWSELNQPFFGDEFSYFASTNLGISKKLSFGVTYLRRFTAYGDEQMIGFGFSL